MDKMPQMPEGSQEIEMLMPKLDEWAKPVHVDGLRIGRVPMDEVLQLNAAKGSGADLEQAGVYVNGQYIGSFEADNNPHLRFTDEQLDAFREGRAEAKDMEGVEMTKNADGKPIITFQELTWNDPEMFLSRLRELLDSKGIKHD